MRLQRLESGVSEVLVEFAYVSVGAGGAEGVLFGVARDAEPDASRESSMGLMAIGSDCSRAWRKSTDDDDQEEASSIPGV